MNEFPEIRWLDNPEVHDFQAAADYLSLIYGEAAVATLYVELAVRTKTILRYKAKDLLRASGLRPLGRKNPHVRSDLEKIRDGKALSPVLLVRDPNRVILVIADGVHRISAARIVDENTVVPCRFTVLGIGTPVRFDPSYS